MKLKNVSLTALAVLYVRVALAKQGRRKDDASIKLVKSSLWHLHFNQFIANVREYLGNIYLKIKTTENNLIISRLAFFDEQLLHEIDDDANGTLQQIVLLGGGFDTTLFKPEVVRATAKGVRLFEVDRYPTQRFKCEAVEAAGLDTTHITYVICDFMEENWLDCLKQAGFDVTKKTYILWEGVTYYLNEKGVSTTLQLFSDNFVPGSTINFDLCDELYKVPWLLRAGLRGIGEPWLFGTPCTKDAIRSWQGSFGLQMKRFKIIKDSTFRSNFAAVSVVKT